MTTIQSILYRLTEAVNGTDKELYTEDELNKFASFYLDKWDENTSENIIAESFTDFWWLPYSLFTSKIYPRFFNETMEMEGSGASILRI